MPEIQETKAVRPKAEIIKKTDRKDVEFRETTPTAFRKIMQIQKSRNLRARSRLVERIETPELLCKRNVVKEFLQPKLPKLTKSFQLYEEKKDSYLKTFVEDLQSYKGGNILNTSATKLPKHVDVKEITGVHYKTDEVDFDTQMKKYRKQLLEKEFNNLNGKGLVNTFQQAKIIPNLLEKINEIKSAISKIEDEYSRL